MQDISDTVTDKYSISPLLHEEHRATVATHNRVDARVVSVRWVLYIIAISSRNKRREEQEKATGTRDRREIYMKIERRIDRCVLHKIDVSRIMRGDIFIPRHVSGARCSREHADAHTPATEPPPS